MKNTKLSIALVGLLTLSTSSFADDTADIAELKQQVKDLKEMTQILTDETSDLQTGFNYTTVDSEKRHSGLGPAASKVYYSKSPLSIGGYGEMYYSNTTNDDDSHDSETQVKRFITYFGYKFSDSIVLNAEIEYEGGGVTASGSGDEVKVEFVYIDFLINENFNIRTGNFLVPMGLTNQQHEPTLFTTVQRPSTSKYIIPTTWNESGAMAYGNIVDGLEYKVALINALQPINIGDKWLRNGRGGAFETLDVKAAGVARLDYTGVNGLLVGASIYGDSDVLILDAHLDYKFSGARVYGTYAQTSRSTDAVGAVTDSFGGYINASYDVLTLTNSSFKLPLFVQYEAYNPQSDLKGLSSPREDTKNTSLGINFFPHEQIVLKADYVFSSTGNIDNEIASLSMGFIF